MFSQHARWSKASKSSSSNGLTEERENAYRSWLVVYCTLSVHAILIIKLLIVVLVERDEYLMRVSEYETIVEELQQKVTNNLQCLSMLLKS